MANRKEVISIEYRGFYIRYDDEKNTWHSKDAMDQEVSGPSLNAVKALLLRKERKSFEPIKMLYKGYHEGWAIVEVYAINPQNKAFFQIGNKKDSRPFSEKHWGGDITYNFFACTPENKLKMARVNALMKDIEKAEKDIEKVEASMIPAKNPKS